MPNDVAYLRAEAKRCRDLAEHIKLQAPHDILEQMADEFERRADRLERLELNMQMPGPAD